MVSILPKKYHLLDVNWICSHFQASSSANSSSDDLSGDETSLRSSKPGFVIKMESFPGSNADISAGHQQPRLGQHNSQMTSYGSQMNASNMQAHNTHNTMAPDLSSLQQNYRGTSNEQPFSFTAMLQDSDPQLMFDTHANNGSHQVHNNHSVYPGHQNVPDLNQQQYRLYTPGCPPDNQVMNTQQFHGQSSYNGETIDRGALNQLSFSSVNQGYPMAPGMQQYHGMGNEATPWNTRQQGGGNLQGAMNTAVQDGQQAAPRLEQPKSTTKLGGGMGHALPQLPAPRTSRVQVRPKAPSAMYSGPGSRPLAPRPGPEPGHRLPGDPFSLLKKNIRDLEQKDHSKPEVNPSPTPHSVEAPFSNRCYDNVSPADSLPGSTVLTESEVPRSNSSTEDGHSIRAYTDHQGYKTPADASSQQKLSGQGAVPITSGVNACNDDGLGKTGNGESPANALTDSLESTGSDNEDSEEEGEDSSDFSPKKEDKPPPHQPTSTSDGQPWNSKGAPSPALQGQPPGNVTVMAGGGFQMTHPGESLAARESQMYGPPGNVTVMAGGGFHVKHSREPNSLHPSAQGHDLAPPNAAKSSFDNVSQPRSQNSTPNAEVSHHGKQLDTNTNINNSQQAVPNDLNHSQRPGSVPEASLGVPHAKPPESRSPSDMYDFRSSIMEQAKLKQQDSSGVKPSQLPMMHAAHQAHNPFDPTQAMYGAPFYAGVDYSKRDPKELSHQQALGNQQALGHQQALAHQQALGHPQAVGHQQVLGHQQLPLHSKASNIPLQSQPLKKRKLYENVEQEVPTTPPSKIWRPGVDPSSAPVSTATTDSSSVKSKMEDSKNKLPEQYEQKTPDSSSESKKVSPSTSVKLSPTSSSNPVGRDSSFPGRSSPHVPHAQAMGKQSLSLAHLKQENGKAPLAPKPEPVNSPKHMVSMTQPSLSTSTHPTFVTVPGLAQPGLYPQGHPGAMPAAQPQMAMMGLPPSAFPYYHPYMMQVSMTDFLFCYN